MIIPHHKLSHLASSLKGDLFTDYPTRLLYATDASVYREVPVAVCRPRDKEDILTLIRFARKNHIPLIPRTAGTSLAGQVVGNGLVVDVSKYMTRIIEINEKENWIKVEPGVILDEMNKQLEPLGLFFGPETSTSNRCMIGGMVGNNSCGAHSLVYGSTRDHTIEIKACLSDGTEAVFGPLTLEELESKCKGNKLENHLYRHITGILGDSENQKHIRSGYPDPAIKRRNTGYALDLLLDCEPFTSGGPAFNLCRLLAGSEGTLAFFTEIKLNLVPLPPAHKALVCVHCATLNEAFEANLVALNHQPVAIELMDQVILRQTANNIEQRKNRFFIEGDPAAILVVEFTENTPGELIARCQSMVLDLKHKGYGYHYPVITGSDIGKVWALRKAGLGILSNIPGDAKPVAVIEDTAVNPVHLPQYMANFQEMLHRFGLDCVYYAHIATGELHLRPILNLKDPEHVELFRKVATETARLVKKYNGSLSGEHGDGRLRGEFIPFMLGQHNYELIRSVKESWDPEFIFNPGKIVETPPMNTSLRYEQGVSVQEPKTFLDFSDTLGIIRATEQCNGSGDCRKTEITGGTMCPSYMATRDENTTTRARANLLREFLSRSAGPNPFDYKELYDILDLCLSCKGCKAECPSNVDIAKYKTEFLQHYHDANGIPLRTRAIAYIAQVNRIAMFAPAIYNFLAGHPVLSRFIKKLLGFASGRSLPDLAPFTLVRWARNNIPEVASPKGYVYLFADEFTNYNDVFVGQAAIRLLTRLGYQVTIPVHTESGRTYLSKGLVRTAAKRASKNVDLLHPLISEITPLIGIEPSAILTFRDEYPDMLRGRDRQKALELAQNTLMFDEFIYREKRKGNISPSDFTSKKAHIRLHGHCHQKALASTGPTKEMLSIPVNYTVEELNTGCCGMAGSFGYEKEHYELSMQVGELVLFPEIRKTAAGTIIAAPGTSCRHQIKDATGIIALHPVEILYQALI